MWGASLAMLPGRSSLTQNAWPTSKFKPIEGAFSRSATSRYWSVVSSSRPGSGSIKSRTPRLLGVLGQRLQDLDEKVDRLASRLAGRERAAGLGRDVRCAQLGAKRKRPPGVIDPDLAVVTLGLDERRMPVGLAVVVHRVHHERVDVRERQAGLFHRLQDAALLHVEQAGRPGVRHVGQQLEPLVTQAGDAPGGLVEGCFR